MILTGFSVVPTELPKIKRDYWMTGKQIREEVAGYLLEFVGAAVGLSRFSKILQWKCSELLLEQVGMRDFSIPRMEADYLSRILSIEARGKNLSVVFDNEWVEKVDKLLGNRFCDLCDSLIDPMHRPDKCDSLVVAQVIES